MPRPASRRADLARGVTRLTLRPVSVRLPANELGVGIARRVLAGSMALGGVSARGITVTPVDSETTGAGHGPVGRVKGEWLRPDEPEPGGVVLYVHGSGYNLCSVRTHRPLVSQVAARTGLQVFSAEYRLAPRHTFPAAADDIERAYRWLLAQGWAPAQVLLAGDSAGGHLILDLALHLLRNGEESPAGLVMFSPLVDPTFELARGREEVRPDPMTSAEAARRLVGHYLQDVDPAHPRLTHALEAHEALPPTLIQAGGAEMLAADAHHLHDMLAASGTDVTLEVWPGQMHVFQAALRFVPESYAALDRAARFARSALAERAGTTIREEDTA